MPGCKRVRSVRRGPVEAIVATRSKGAGMSFQARPVTWRIQHAASPGAVYDLRELAVCTACRTAACPYGAHRTSSAS